MRLLALVVLLLMSVGCSGSGTAEPPLRDPLVEVAVAKRGTLPVLLTLRGTARARERAAVNTSSVGIVARVGPRAGDRVAAGQAVVWLESDELAAQVRQQEAAVQAAAAKVRQLEASLDMGEVQVGNDVTQARQAVQRAQIAVVQAKTELQAAQKDMQRKQQLYTEKAIAQAQVDQAVLAWKVSQDQLKTAQSQLQTAQTQLQLARDTGITNRGLRSQLEGALADLQQAQASLEASRLALSRTVLRAPISGTVVDRSVEPGQAVGPTGSGLMTIIDTTSIEAMVEIDQRYAASIRRGMPADLRTTLHLNESFPARVVDVIPATDPQTGTARVRVRLVGPGSRLMDGVQVQVGLAVDRRSGVLIPVTAVEGRDAKPYIFVIAGTVAQRREVTVETQDQTFALVSGPVKVGDTVVSQGADDLRDGQTVRVE